MESLRSIGGESIGENPKNFSRREFPIFKPGRKPRAGLWAMNDIGEVL
jgi:hypothetical protein